MQTMSIEDRVKATLKNVEGKLQEAVGDVTGDPREKAENRDKRRIGYTHPRL